MQPDDSPTEGLIRNHPLFPVLELLTQKCSRAMVPIDDPCKETKIFSLDDVNKLIYSLKAASKSNCFTTDNSEIDRYLQDTILNLRVQLLELSKLWQLCRLFTERYTEFLKNTTDMTSISTDDSFSPEIPSSISPSLNLSTEDEEGEQDQDRSDSNKPNSLENSQETFSEEEKASVDTKNSSSNSSNMDTNSLLGFDWTQAASIIASNPQISYLAAQLSVAETQNKLIGQYNASLLNVNGERIEGSNASGNINQYLDSQVVSCAQVPPLFDTSKDSRKRSILNRTHSTSRISKNKPHDSTIKQVRQHSL